MQNFSGKVAFVTGGASGIGFGMVRAFLAEGMKVAIADMSDENLADARDALAGSNAVHLLKWMSRTVASCARRSERCSMSSERFTSCATMRE